MHEDAAKLHAVLFQSVQGLAVTYIGTERERLRSSDSLATPFGGARRGRGERLTNEGFLDARAATDQMGCDACLPKHVHSVSAVLDARDVHRGI